MLTKFRKRIVEKPWGRTDIPSTYGEFGGRRVGEIWFEHPADETAPVMAKFLFTAERLSIQVHPDAEAGQRDGHAYGKDECWLVLDAEPGAQVGVGLTEDSDAASLRRASLDGTIEAMVDWRPAAAGDFIYNPAGTIHAIGAGLTLVEVQQNIDCTYRLYDYGRPRTLHLEAGLAVATMTAHRNPRDSHVKASDNRSLVSGPYFHLIHLSGPSGAVDLPAGPGDYGLLPLSTGCSVGGEAIGLGECVALCHAGPISLEYGARALLFWPA